MGEIVSSDRVKLTLANPLRTKDAEELGLEPRVYQTGEEIELPRASAYRLAGSGYVKGAEPGNPATVNAALTPVDPPAPPAPAPAVVAPVVVPDPAAAVKKPKAGE